MRTTIDLPDDLLRRAKIHAAEKGVTLKEVFAAGLEKELSEAKREPRRKGMGRPVPVVIEGKGWAFPFRTNAELFEAVEREES